MKTRIPRITEKLDGKIFVKEVHKTIVKFYGIKEKQSVLYLLRNT